MTDCICEPGDCCCGTGYVDWCIGCGGDFCCCAACNGWGMSTQIECHGCPDCVEYDPECDDGDESASESACGRPW